ncbi:MAG: hypothetical protein HC835_15965 [Oscillatoriales cyanobacterium RM2_1_1]|nr:hypothetical protein [Oscillatoriales cyanobacterium SM2_3_0]NJO46990.1 hypothetical protein [Oscillatoriales cyanobacterium RM2_1_1]
MKLLNSVKFILYLSPILGTIWFVQQYGVDVPFFDQWNLPFLFEKAVHGRIRLNNLFALHNTHRIFFPRIIFLILAFISSWNIKLELYFSLAVAVLTFVRLHQLANLTLPYQQPRLWFHGTNIIMGCLFFSWVQWENWLWGFQIAIFLINFCLVSSCLALSSERLKPSIKIGVASVFCAVASFSSLQGLITWLALVPSILALKGRGKIKVIRLAFWLFLLVISGLIYSIDYQPEPEAMNLTDQNPTIFASIQFFLNMIAAPISGNITWSWMVGLVILVAFLTAVLLNLFKFHQINQQVSSFQSLAPWISLGLFSLLYCGLTTLGRFQLGAVYAIETSRYTTHSLFLIIATLQLFLVLIYAESWQQQLQKQQLQEQQHLPWLSTRFKFRIYGLVLGLLIGLILARSRDSLHYVNTFYNPIQTTGKTCVDLIHYLENSTFFAESENSCLFRIHPQPRWVRTGVFWLERIGLRQFPEEIPFMENPPLDYGYINLSQPSQSQTPLTPDQQIQINGWAILPNCQPQPKLVFLSRNHEKFFFANADIHLESADVAQVFQSECYGRSRWMLKLPAHYLPVGKTTIHGWVYAPADHQLVRLKGEVSVTVQGELPPELN